MKLQISIDDYHPNNVVLAALIKKHGLVDKTIFFLDLRDTRLEPIEWEKLSNGGMIQEDRKEQLKLLSNMGFEIGSHNVWHDNDLEEKSLEEQKFQIEKSKELIEWYTGKPCKAYCYNRGRSNEQIRKLVKDAGYEWARGTKVLYTESEDKFNLGTTIHCFERKEYVGRVDFGNMGELLGHSDVIRLDWLEYAKVGFDMVNNDGGYFHIWGHFKELSRPGELNKFEEILKYIKSNV